MIENSVLCRNMDAQISSGDYGVEPGSLGSTPPTVLSRPHNSLSQQFD